MRIIIIHHEARCFAGAEKLLVDFLTELTRQDGAVTIALVQGSELDKRVPPGIQRLFIPDGNRFSISSLMSQLRTVLREHRETRFDLIHGWSARDWELTALSRFLSRIPAVGTLHDHPQASFIRPKRQRMMRWLARWGLDRLFCVSEAVRTACVEAGYPSEKLTTVLNGIPCPQTTARPIKSATVRLGFLGAFCERKGLRGLFAMISEMDRLTTCPWKLIMAGATQDGEGEAMMADIRREYQNTGWWSRVDWRGWIASPMKFLEDIDILICPSSQFEPFGLVLCEAGLAGIPVLATRVGGIPEIVRPDESGWLIEPGDWKRGAELLVEAMTKPELCRELGERGNERIRCYFSIEKMTGQYLKHYSTVRRDE